MSIIDGLRSQFPMYDDLSDAELLEGYRNKFHPDTSLQELEELYADKIEREERERQLENQGFFGRAADLIERRLETVTVEVEDLCVVGDEVVEPVVEASCVEVVTRRMKEGIVLVARAGGRKQCEEDGEGGAGHRYSSGPLSDRADLCFWTG